MDIITELEHIVALPSWCVADSPDVEVGVATYLTKRIQAELSWLHIDHERIGGNRFNIFAADDAPLQLLFVGHLDTLPPGTGWTRRSIGERDGDRFYGCGAFDVKGGIIALLTALAASGPTRGVGVLLYCDGLGEFRGMRAFIAQSNNRLHPDLVVAVEPTNLCIGHGCRGVCEFRVVVRGRGGHAASREGAVRSAFTAFVRGVEQLREFAKHHTDQQYGHLTFNVAAVRCGQSIEATHDDCKLLGDAGNIVPDYAEGVIEVRTLPNVDVDTCIEAFRRGVEESECKLESAVKRFDFPGFATDPARLQRVVDAITAGLGKVEFSKFEDFGYSDIQLVSAQWGVPCAMFGPKGGNIHAADEYVDLPSLAVVTKTFELILAPHRISA
ncbi:MAG: M20/M25/M40 family metallo-hydrolase [Candidatus Uhrbacteria bacterium]